MKVATLVRCSMPSKCAYHGEDEVEGKTCVKKNGSCPLQLKPKEKEGDEK